MNRQQSISESTDFKLMDTHFESGKDTTILVHQRKRGSKFEGAQQKRRTVQSTNHTISVLPAGKTRPTILSKQDVVQDNADQSSFSKKADRQLMASRGEAI